MNRVQIRRVCLVDRAIRVLPNPSKESIRQYVCDELGEYFCASSIEKDINYMRLNFDAPIVFTKKNKSEWHANGCRGHYFYSDENYNFSVYFIHTLSSYLDFPKDVEELINSKL